MATLYTLAAMVFAIIAFIFGVAKKARDYGRAQAENERHEDNAQLQMEFDKIDNQRPNVDDALGRLSKRASGGRSASPK